LSTGAIFCYRYAQCFKADKQFPSVTFAATCLMIILTGNLVSECLGFLFINAALTHFPFYNKILFLSSASNQPHLHIEPKSKYSTCLSTQVNYTLFSLFGINCLWFAASSLVLSLCHADVPHWLSIRNASSMSFVLVATVVLEAIVNPPSVWFVLIPCIRGVSLFIMQSFLIYGLLKAKEERTLDVISEVTSKMQFPSELDTKALTKV
jgi:hypothetical protein